MLYVNGKRFRDTSANREPRPIPEWGKESGMISRFRFAPLVLLFVAGLASASSPHYVNGSQGLNVATLPAPGQYFALGNYFYTANQVRDNDGNKLDADLKAFVYLTTPSFMYAARTKILGADYAASIAVPFVYIKASMEKNIKLPDFFGFHDINFRFDDHSFGLSDIVMAPVMLNWRFSQLDLRADFAVIAPTGKYDHKDPTSVGRGMWSFLPGLGATLYFDKERTWNFSIMSYYELHTKQRTTDVIPGNHFHFEWGLGKRFANYWQIGAAGYASWQVTKDHGGGASDSKTRAFAVGPELNVTIPKWRNTEIVVRSEWEFGNRSNTQGNATSCNLVVNF